MIASPIEVEYVLKWRVGPGAARLIAEVAGQCLAAVCLPDESLEPGARLRLRIEGPGARQARRALDELFTMGGSEARCRRKGCGAAASLEFYTPGYINYACVEGHHWSVRR